jgi:16S rRNA (guanine527-N7)-methyltransferase
MPDRDVAVRILKRTTKAGITASAELVGALAVYLDLLARWNRRINLTALDVDPPGDEAIDRLIVEPLVAAKHLLPADRLAIDIGSGGGSPAIPLKLAAPSLRLVLVEVKVRKSAFLREAVRQLGLSEIDVENRRFEELLARRDLHEAADVVTLRAVRIDRKLLASIQAVLKIRGRVFCFGSGSDPSPEDVWPFRPLSSSTLVAALNTRLVVLEKTS